MRVKVTIFVISLLVLSSVATAKAQTTEINFPNFEIEEFTLNMNDDNDIYIGTEQYHQLLNYDFSFNASSMSQRNYDTYSRSGATTRNADVSFDFGNNEGIMAYQNSTNAGQELSYSRNYFGLISNENDDISNVLIETGNTYLASFELEANELATFRFLFAQITGGTTLVLTLSIVDPEGNFDTVDVDVTKDLTQIVPFVASSSGVHYLSIETDTTGILDDMIYQVSPSVEDLSTGYIDRLQEDNSFVKFLRVQSSDEAQVIDFNAIVFQNEYLVNEFSTTVFGDLRIVVFLQNSLMFGFESSDALMVSASDIYIALVATPADDNNPAIRKARAEEGYTYGMDIDITLTLRKYTIDTLPTGENFESVVKDQYSVASDIRYYSFVASQELVVGVNASTGQAIDFISNDPEIGTLSVDPGNNDILNVLTDDAVILPAGSYVVEVPIDQTYWVSVFQPTTLEFGTSRTITGTIDDIDLFYLPASEVSNDLIDVTYLDQVNQTATYSFEFYDFDGNRLGILTADRSETFEYYINALDNLVFNNVTTTNPTITRNVEGLYLRVQVTGNEQYINGTVAYSDATNTTSQIRIDRVNEYRELQENNPSDAYYYDTLNQALSYDTLSDNNTIQFILDYTSQANKVYKLIIDSTNRSIIDYDLQVRNSLAWYTNLNMLSALNISNIDHYILEVVFATTIPIHMGMFIALGTENFNGTVDINLVELDVTSLPELNIGSLNSEGILLEGDSGDDGIGLLSNPLFYVAVIGGVAVIGAAIFIIRRRGGFGKKPF